MTSKDIALTEKHLADWGYLVTTSGKCITIPALGIHRDVRTNREKELFLSGVLETLAVTRPRQEED